MEKREVVTSRMEHANDMAASLRLGGTVGLQERAAFHSTKEVYHRRGEGRRISVSAPILYQYSSTSYTDAEKWIFLKL